MNVQDLKDRLNLLLEKCLIKQKEYDIATIAFERLLKMLNKHDIEQAEMLFTHLPMALSRIEKGEEVEKPAVELMKEVKNSNYFPLAKEHVFFIENKWGAPLPEGEKEFLYMHYTNVINLNSQGGQ
ncbi:PRD domain-containing protein [Virgibacillus chiguensis]|uniref:PRD domain-containing protein n=1 Tax=Virgibacillus chiguensis TaxID=411959 RepID=A0A1M5RF30_9BACI|nr:PRD domain-containing protein [Virgibacillus chiguensis]SHH24884.1 PRD domain-containing protein [Virgibacillus chiguensis]